MEPASYVLFHRIREQYFTYADTPEMFWTNQPDSAARFDYRTAARKLRSFGHSVRRNVRIIPVSSLPKYN